MYFLCKFEHTKKKWKNKNWGKKKQYVCIRSQQSWLIFCIHFSKFNSRQTCETWNGDVSQTFNVLLRAFISILMHFSVVAVTLLLLNALENTQNIHSHLPSTIHRVPCVICIVFSFKFQVECRCWNAEPWWSMFRDTNDDYIQAIWILSWYLS